MRSRFVIAQLLALVLPAMLAAQRQQGRASPEWDVTQPRGTTRDIDFTTSEGTWMAVDISPDSHWIYFDLLGQIYRMPAGGGEAECLTQTTGVALNYQPRISPDGKTIAFISDRRGQDNLWIMNADGSDPRPVFTDLQARAVEPAWTADSRFIIVRREPLGRGGDGGASGGGLYMYSRDGGNGMQLVAAQGRNGPEWPSTSADGKYVYYYVRMTVPDEQPLAGSEQLRRLELKTGEIVDITSGEATGPASNRISSGGGAAPEISPDGRWLAFVREIPDGTVSWKGHKYGPRSALWLRDLHTGAERVLMDPIEPQSETESKALGVLPLYKWANDGQSLVISVGGKIRRVAFPSGAVSTIPFTARVHRVISQMAKHEFRITDEPIAVKFMRWHTASPDGKQVAFQAVGHVYVADASSCLPQTTVAQASSCRARRVTPSSFEHLEYAPAWSPDGRSLAFVTFDDSARGEVWKVASAGGAPQRLTSEPGDYVDPVWSPDGQSVVVAKGEGATARGRTVTANSWFELDRFPANPPAGGAVGQAITLITRPTNASPSSEARRQLPRPSFGPDGRIFFPEEQAAPSNTAGGPAGRGAVVALVSVKPDGTDKRTHLVFPFADEIAPSPDGRYVAFQEGDNVYVAPFAYDATGGKPLRIEKRKGDVPVTQLSSEGGDFPRWRDAATVEYGSGTHYFARHMDSGRTDTLALSLTVPRAIPQGSVALTNTRIVTMDHRKVIDRGTIVVKGSRIACVGECSTSGVDRVIDEKGKTIIPGFVDMHSHHYREWRGMRPAHDYETAIYLAYGVTTDEDVSMWSQNVFPTAEAIEAGEIMGPRTFSTGDPMYAGDAARNNDISSFAVAHNDVARLVDWGAVAIKQYMEPRRDQRQWIAESARQLGANVTAEGGDLMYNLSMIMDGQTGWEHPMGIGPMYDDAAKFFGKAQATYSPTLVVAGPGPWNIEYFYASSDVWKDAKQRRWFPWRMLIPHLRVRELRPTTDYSWPMLSQQVADLIANGGNAALGSHGEHHGLNAHWEVWMEAAANGNLGALEIGTIDGARFLGADKDIGSIEVGKLADMIVLNSNPLDDIHNTLDMQYVMKGGFLYDAGTLDEVWPKRVPFGPYYWVNPEVLRTDDRSVDVWDKK